jgi:branched-chain amino acid aminotransferase
VIVWVDGALGDVEHARISPIDHGLLVGDGVFETLRVYAGVPFAWTRHLDRLEHSAAGLGLASPARDTVRKATTAVLDANRLTEARLRITVTGGPSPLGSLRGNQGPTLIVAASAPSEWPPAEAVVTVPWTRNERGATAGLKTISYAENVRALAFAAERNASEAIFANNRGELCEATGSNVFVVKAGVVRTPPDTAGCLLGVTRALVLELCSREGVSTEEVDLEIGALAEADEAFLTSSTRELQPISQVDGRDLPAAPGPCTTLLTEHFRALVTSNPDP